MGDTRHRFTSLRLWEQNADQALLPLAVLARSRSGTPEQLLGQVRQRLQAIADPDQRRRITSGCQLLAGLTFPPDVIRRLLAMSILEESSVISTSFAKAWPKAVKQAWPKAVKQAARRVWWSAASKKLQPSFSASWSAAVAP